MEIFSSLISNIWYIYINLNKFFLFWYSWIFNFLDKIVKVFLPVIRRNYVEGLHILYSAMSSKKAREITTSCFCNDKLVPCIEKKTCQYILLSSQNSDEKSSFVSNVWISPWKFKAVETFLLFRCIKPPSPWSGTTAPPQNEIFHL